MSTPIVLVAYQCGPGMGSVSQIGWEWFSRMARRRSVTLITHVRNRNAIEAAGGAPAGSDIDYIDTEWLAGPLYRAGKRLFPRSEHATFMVASLDFFLFDWIATRRVRTRLRQGAGWALAHIVTPVTLAAPSQLHRCGLPVVRGPLNCGLQSPPGFSSHLRHEREWVIKLRNLPRLFDVAFGSSRGTCRFLSATRATTEALPAVARDRTTTMIENGIDPARFQATPWPAAPGTATPLRVLFVGRLIALKGVDLLLEAVRRVPDAGHCVELRIVGDGPERQNLEASADAIGLSAITHFTGNLDHAGVAREMAACHLLCLPSVRESGGAVLLEAMASGRPVVALDYGGPAEIVDDTVGALLACERPEQVIADLAATLSNCFREPANWAIRAAEAAQRARARYDWEAKLDAAEQIYATCCRPAPA